MALTIKQERFCQEYLEYEDVYFSKHLAKIDSLTEYGSQYYVYFLVNPITNQILYWQRKG